MKVLNEKRAVLLVAFIQLSLFLSGQVNYQSPGAGNPLIPGYFADPTVKKFGDTWYIYATTDGNGGGLGPSQVWTSKDFVNWSMRPMNWPVTPYYWAPDVTKADNGKYYMYYCQPVEIYGASSATPVGPWTPLLPGGEPLVKNYLIPDVITLDGQTFRDDDGKMYLFWGTWGIYPNSGCGIGLLNKDMKSFSRFEKLPNTIAKDFFEAPFMFKRNGIYYLTYSSGRCEDDTYRVQYVMSKTGPTGPFEYGKNNPVLATNEDGSIHGPGHQSVIQNGKDFYLVYHRHNNPHSGGGFHRQVCADKLEFDEDGSIRKVIPTHSGIGLLAENTNPSINLALGKPVTASSFYSENFRPSFAADDNNSTLWKAADNMGSAWLQIDLEKQTTVKRVQIQFEYATWYYQYLIEYSVDGRQWKVFADKRENRRWGSPMEDYGNIKTRFIRIKITDTQYPGLNRAIWNIKVYNDAGKGAGELSEEQSLAKRDKPAGLLIDLNASELGTGSLVKEWANKGSAGGTFISGNTEIPYVGVIRGKKAVVFSGREYFKSAFAVPSTLSGNSSYTVSMWVFNPSVEKQEPVLSWANGSRELSRASVGYGSERVEGGIAHGGWPDLPYNNIPEAGRWHHIAVVFDGTMERLFVDGKLDNEENKMLFLKEGELFYVGTSEWLNSFYSGALSELKVYDRALSSEEIQHLRAADNRSPEIVYLNVSGLPYGVIEKWTNEGYASGGLEVTEKSLVVEDKGGKISVKIERGAVLRFTAGIADSLKLMDTYTLSASVYNEKEVSLNSILNVMQNLRPETEDNRYKEVLSKGSWHQIIQTYKNGKLSKIYLDGASLPISSDGDTGDFSRAEVSLSELIVYNREFSIPEIEACNAEWRNGFNNQLSATRSGFSKLPLAISDDMVRMVADTAKGWDGKLQYYFVQQGKINAGSGWLNDPLYMSYGLSPNTVYYFSVKVKDHLGNVSIPSTPVKVKTDSKLFTIYSDDFSKNHDFLNSGVNGTVWDGFVGKFPDGSATKIASEGGSLLLESADSKWDGSDPAGPFLYREVEGDFILRAMVKDISGLAERRPAGANEAGLMVRFVSADKPAGLKECLIQNSIMPGWGVGNLITSLGDFGRIQTNNTSAWEFFRFLQIRKEDDMFYMQGSNDGRIWNDLPGSPLKRPDLNGMKLQAGLFHATYGRQRGFASFDNMKIFLALKEGKAE